MSRLAKVRARLDHALDRERLPVPLVCRRHWRPVRRRTVSHHEKQILDAGHPLACSWCGHAVHPEYAVLDGAAVKR